MPSGLSTLIRLHKHELDEKRRALAELYAVMAALEQERLTLERTFEAERQAVDQSGDVHFTFARYAETVKKKQEDLNAAKAALEQHIDQVKHSLMETFAEMKKYEMTEAERQRLEEEEQSLREDREMDDIGMEGFRRKSDENGTA